MEYLYLLSYVEIRVGIAFALAQFFARLDGVGIEIVAKDIPPEYRKATLRIMDIYKEEEIPAWYLN
jgi:uncharacterized UPF0146 family protein